MYNTDFTWDETSGYATCALYVDGKKYCGDAHCCPDDLDMISKRTGYEIAYRRAEIQYIKYLKRRAYIAYKAIEHLYSTIRLSSKLNYESIEYKAITRELRNALCEYNSFKELLAERRNSLNTYISEKDKFYKQFRLGRFKKNNQNKNT